MITKELLRKFADNFNNATNLAAAYGVAKAGLKAAAVDPQMRQKHQFVYSLQTKMGEITNQKQSGRCWMFAALNAARVASMEKYNLKTLEFSQAYTFFWDKLEKANAFLTAIIETAGEDVHSRLVSHLLAAPVQDGGQWDMFSGILEKYGIVPKDAMPETYNSSASREMVEYLTSKLREYACELRKMVHNGASKEDLTARLESMLSYVYTVLVKCLGVPPTEVVYEYYDKDEVFHRTEPMTPQAFLKNFVGWDLTAKVSLINAPTADKPYYKAYTVKYLYSVLEGRPIKYVNLPIEELKAAAIKSLQAGEPVWFGCDVGKYLDRDTGIMDLDQFHYAEVLGEKLRLDKAERLDYGDSLLTHAMVLTGVNLDANGKPLTWKVENSWSDKAGNKGVFSMSDRWFDEFTYEVMVDKKYVSEKAKAAAEGEVIALEPWDPMGALAE